MQENKLKNLGHPLPNPERDEAQLTGGPPIRASGTITGHPFGTREELASRRHGEIPLWTVNQLRNLLLALDKEILPIKGRLTLQDRLPPIGGRLGQDQR
jgi:hypothetical protein